MNEEKEIQPWHAGANFLYQVRENDFGGKHFKSKVQMCMFCGNVNDAKRSLNELKRSIGLNYNITAVKKAPWKSHFICDTPKDFRKFLGFEEEDFKDGNNQGN